ncbi:MAG: SHOCT domain-containing protein [Pseudonocardiaceae bacterium]|nr:SHOCT domain-containing protein [Pseudonocardiaceae bacterium]
MMDGGMMGWMLVWPLFVLVGLALLGYVVFRLVQGGSTSAPAVASSARQILDERFARGEIDEQQYRRMRDELR